MKCSHLIVLFAITFSWSVGGQSNICNVCICKGTVINCKNHQLNQTFDTTAWTNTVNGKNFTEVHFDNNHIGHLTKFPNVTTLVVLSFHNNRIVKIDDRAFKELTALEELDLSRNELTSDNLLPSVFEGPYDSINYEPLVLKTLDLSSNELHTLHQDIFEHLPVLRRLYLRRNPFKILDKPTVIAISSLPNLEILDLSYTKIKALPPGFLHTPKKLHELVLRGNFFTEVPSDILVESHDLRILNLNENPIQAITTERPFPEMPSLKQLHISFMSNLTRIEEGSLSGLTGLEFLYCRMNMHLKYISGEAFGRGKPDMKRPNITKIDLSDNALRYIDHDFLKPFWNNLTYLNIMGNPLVCDCENQWMVSDLVPLLVKISSPVAGLDCSEPSAMKGRRFVKLHSQNSSMRCLDYYDNHPEKDGPILISIFIIIILTLIIILLGALWLRSSHYCRTGSGSYQRAFYRPAKIDDSDRY